MSTVLIPICAWCQRLLREPSVVEADDAGPYMLSHGQCDACAEVMARAIDEAETPRAMGDAIFDALATTNRVLKSALREGQ